jgi:hypothetical protein
MEEVDGGSIASAVHAIAAMLAGANDLRAFARIAGCRRSGTTKSQFETYLYVLMFLDSGSHRRTKTQWRAITIRTPGSRLDVT